MNRKTAVAPTPAEVLSGLAVRARAARLRRGWTQHELAVRAGMSFATVRGFERTGRIGVVRLVAIAGALGALAEFAGLFPAPPARSLDEIEQRAEAVTRRRGRRRRPVTPQRESNAGRGDDAR